MWLLKIWLVPGTTLSSSVRCRRYAVPPLRAGTDVGGANSDGADSQYCVVAGTASSGVVGHDGTENGALAAFDSGGMMRGVAG